MGFNSAFKGLICFCNLHKDMTFTFVPPDWTLFVFVKHVSWTQTTPSRRRVEFKRQNQVPKDTISRIFTETFHLYWKSSRWPLEIYWTSPFTLLFLPSFPFLFSVNENSELFTFLCEFYDPFIQNRKESSSFTSIPITEMALLHRTISLNRHLLWSCAINKISTIFHIFISILPHSTKVTNVSFRSSHLSHNKQSPYHLPFDSKYCICLRIRRRGLKSHPGDGQLARWVSFAYLTIHRLIIAAGSSNVLTNTKCYRYSCLRFWWWVAEALNCGHVYIYASLCVLLLVYDSN
jgi:hypothetical protein